MYKSFPTNKTIKALIHPYGLSHLMQFTNGLCIAYKNCLAKWLAQNTHECNHESLLTSNNGDEVKFNAHFDSLRPSDAYMRR